MKHSDSEIPRELSTIIERGIEQCRRHCEHPKLCDSGQASRALTSDGRLVSTTTRHCRLARQVAAEIVMEELRRLRRAEG